ncbi:MAG: magnesium transporter [Candidatus Kapabacteria bacterium]|nr:magnesium transporter [Candidatus Kapabacteria bacterium]
MLKELLKPEIKELIDSHQWSDLREVLESWSPAEISDLILDIEKQNRVLLYRTLDRDTAHEVFAYLDPEQQDNLLRDLTDQETRELLSEMSPDDRTLLMEELPAKVTRRLLELLDPDDLKEARWLLGYPEESIGRLMTPDFVAVRPYWTIRRAIDHIKQHGRDSETINRIYVRDDNGVLVDDIMLRSIILANEDDVISDIMEENVVRLSAFDDQEQAVRMMEKYDLPALPVVDSQGVLVGIVTFDDVLDIAEQEATEDIQKLGGMEALDNTYKATSLLEMVRKRVGWLAILLVSEMLTTSVLAYFEGAIEKAAILVLFIPLIISSGGNSGSQAATLIIRALAVEEIKLSDWAMVLRRELLSGILLGGTLGVIGFLRIAAWTIFDPVAYGDHSILIGITVGLSLVGIVLWGTIIGSMLPFVLKKLRFDPATSSAPFVATLVDVIGIIIYFAVAMMILRGTVL